MIYRAPANLNVHIVPALKDNYVYLLQKADKKTVWAVDPGDDLPVLRYLSAHSLSLAGVVCTHHHPDHTAGIAGLLEHFHCPVITSAHDKTRIAGATLGVTDGEILELESFSAVCLSIPGHTLGHTAFFLPEHKSLFCGDTLFAMGCGRLFEGRPEQLQASLHKLLSLPIDTLCFCGHEYSLANAGFALELEPNNLLLIERRKMFKQMREAGKPTMPTTLTWERETNPFLRTDSVEIRRNLDLSSASDIEVFTALRGLKDHWKSTDTN